MATYIVKMKPPSHDEFKTWVMMGYLGSYDRYEATVRERGPATMFINGDLGPHCTSCAAPGENLCDYPVGDEKTCDRPMCDDHAHGIAADTHYCRDHFIMWREYLASQRGYDVLDNVTPLGVVRPDAQAIEARRAETERLGAQHESAVASGDAPTPVPVPVRGEGNVSPEKERGE